MSESAARFEAPGDALASAYARTLEDYVAGGGEVALRSAYDLGREAMSSGRSLLVLAAVHASAVAALLERRGCASLGRDLRRSWEIFCECLSSYEMALRGVRESVGALRRLNDTLEHEIQRIARAVHDEAGQLLVAAHLAMSVVSREAGASPTLKAGLEDVSAMLEQAEEGLRRISHELRPSILDDLGLVPALEFLASRVSRGAELCVRVEGALESRPDPHVETALYRIVQEALTNVAKHARARNAVVRLARDEKGIRCTVRDDGAGFDVRAVSGEKGLGLAGMRERLDASGGTLRIDSWPGAGTELRVWIPVGGVSCRSG